MKYRSISLRALAIFTFLCGLSVTVGAQWKDNMGGTWNNPTSASVGNIVNDSLWNRVFAKARERDKARAAAAAASTGKPPPQASPPTGSTKTPAQINSAVSFRSTGTQLETLGIATELAGGDADLKKDLLTLITTLVNEYEKAAKAQGKPNDLALATTSALVYNSSIYNGTAEPDDARIMEIRDALAELMVEGKTFGTMTDRQKQVLYEKLVISTMLAKAGYDEAKEKGDKETMTSYREAAGQTLRMVSGMAPEKIDFSDEAARKMAQRIIDSGQSGVPANTGPVSPPTNNADYLDFDPFPDKPFFQAQQPLIGRLRKSITMADLVGNWTTGGGSIMEYVTSSTQSQTSVSVTRDDFTIRPNGTYESKSQSRLSNTTVRESEKGTVILSGNWVIRRDSNGREMRYQFITFMVLPNGAAMLTLILTPEGPPMDAQKLSYNCGHAHGYITCNAGEEWVRKP